MIIETRDGKRSKILLNTSRGDLAAANNEEDVRLVWRPLDNYNDNLICVDFNDSDIVKVYDMSDGNVNAASISSVGSLVWERKMEIPELTMKEAIEKIGFEFKIKK